MSEQNRLPQIVGRIVSQVLDAHLPRLQAELAERVVQELPECAAVEQSTSSNLLKAVTALHAGNGQREILTSLLNSASEFCGRTALFVVRGGSTVGWQARGFQDDSAIKSVTLAASSPLVARALDEKKFIQGPISQFDSEFVSSFAAPADPTVFLLPLVLRDKVAAILYADCGSSGSVDATSLELLAISCSLWLEVVSFRRTLTGAGHSVGSEAAAGESHAMSELHAEQPQALAAQEAPVAMAAAAGVGGVGTAAPSASPSIAASIPSPAQPISADDEEVHRKAKRFAKLLVDEIKLYNQAQVTEGRKNKDLYDRLKEDIEKSRGAYEKRYGQTAAASASYFDQEVVRVLAENNRLLLGGNYPR